MLLFIEIFFIFIGHFTTEIYKILHMLSAMILHLAVSCPKNAIISDFSGDIYLQNLLLYFAMEILLCKLSYESAIMTLSPAKRSVFIFVVIHKEIPFV